jgi:hypothetical protein
LLAHIREKVAARLIVDPWTVQWYNILLWVLKFAYSRMLPPHSDGFSQSIWFKVHGDSYAGFQSIILMERKSVNLQFTKLEQHIIILYGI